MRLPDGGFYCLKAVRAQPSKLYHLSRYPFSFKLCRRGKRLVDHYAVTDERYVGAFFQQGLVFDIAALVIALSAAGITHRCRTVAFVYRRGQHSVKFGKGRGRVYRHSGHCRKEAEVKGALMRLAVASNKPRAVNGKHGVQTQYRDIMYQHIEAALQEA